MEVSALQKLTGNKIWCLNTDFYKHLLISAAWIPASADWEVFRSSQDFVDDFIILFF